MSGEVGGGARLGSLYVLDQRIGVGAMGTVWAAHNTESGAPVAVKILSDNLAQDPDLVARFLRERSALLSVRHPHLVQILDLVVENDRIALVMELVVGLDALRLIEEHGPMPLGFAARLGTEICEALMAVHAAGIVHRDLKPANILVESSTGAAKLVDFGIAWIAGTPRATAANSIIGTPYYLAPELQTGGAVTPAADVYALGVCLYQLVTGVVPFDGEHYAQVLHKHLTEAPQPHPSIPPPLWSVFEAVLSKDPAARPSADFFARELAAFADPPLMPAEEQAAVEQADPMAGSGSFEAQPVAAAPALQQPQASPYQEAESSLYAAVPPNPFGDYSADEAAPGQWTEGGGQWAEGGGQWTEGGPQTGQPSAPFADGFVPGPPPFSEGFSRGPAPFADGFVPGPPPFSHPEPKVSWWSQRRNRLLVVVGGVVVLALAAGGAVYATTGSHGSKPVAQASASAPANSPSPSPTASLTVSQQRVDRWALIGNADDSIGGRDGVATGVKWTVTDSTHGSVAFDGQPDSQIVVDGAPVVSTSHSFTIAVWVVMNGPTSTTSGWETVVALRGSRNEGAALEYDAADKRWAFDMASGNSADATTDSVLSHDAPATSWYHLVASYDAPSRTMKLYANKVLQGVATHAPSWAADGPLSIGSGISNGQATNWLRGAVSDVQLWKVPLTQAQIAQLG